MSMWPVSSTMTRDLMTAFYAHWLAGMDKHDALRAAQKDLREQEGAGPSEWGAFVLVGGG
jgi:CHAT domain-containing protein